MDLASAYNKLQQPKEDTKPKSSTLAVRTNANVISAFQQAVGIIEPNRWLKASPREIKKEDCYFYLKFSDELDCIRSTSKEQRKNKKPIFTVVKIDTSFDIFQYRNQNGELDMYTRPYTRYKSGMDYSDCFDDKAAFSKLLKNMPDESQIMKNICGEQEHVLLGFRYEYIQDHYTDLKFVLFKDGNAYFFKDPTYYIKDIIDPYIDTYKMNLTLSKMNEQTFINHLAGAIDGRNKAVVDGNVILAPVTDKINPYDYTNYPMGLFVDYLVYNRISYPSIYRTPEKKRQEFKSKGVCSYCGGKFDQSFFKKCYICGKKKDY